jgi:hypothetical protein
MPTMHFTCIQCHYTEKGSTSEANIVSGFILFFYLTKLSSDTTISYYGSINNVSHIIEEMSTMSDLERGTRKGLLNKCDLTPVSKEILILHI